MYRVTVNARTYADGTTRGTPGWSKPGTVLDKAARTLRRAARGKEGAGRALRFQ